MKREYECPDFDCGYDVEVEDDAKQVTCAHCGRLYAVDRDAEFEGGRWRDLTTLHLMREEVKSA